MIENKNNTSKIVAALWNLTAKDYLLDRTAADILSLSQSDAQALAALIYMGPLPAGKIAILLRITSGSSTALIDRLEKAGFAHRLDDKKDRRRVIVEATESGKAATEKIFKVLTERVAKLLGNYNASEIKLIEDFLTGTGDLFLERVEEIEGEMKSRRHG
jgi:DNA-binding MarR family transcriptional regulator